MTSRVLPNSAMKGVRLRSVVGVAVAVLGTWGLLALSRAVGQQVSQDLRLHFVYQALALLIAGLVVGGVVLLKGGRPSFLRWGELSAAARPVKVLDIKPTDSWRKIGITFAVIISAVTAGYLFLAYGAQLGGIGWRSWLFALAVAIPLSATNALTEELITRWAIVESLDGQWARYAPWVAALVFGSVHWFGIPGGPIGALMAGFLGWLTARSIQDIRGIGWAWIIHFCQDVLIFTVTLALFV